MQIENTITHKQNINALSNEKKPYHTYVYMNVLLSYECRRSSNLLKRRHCLIRNIFVQNFG